jgi:probable HAF family extracellular repeat protein
MALAYGINDAGQIVGQDNTGVYGRAFLYEEGTITHLTASNVYSIAQSINNAREVTGWANIPNAHAYIYKDGVMTDIGTLGGTYSFGYAINNNTEVVGASPIADNGRRRAFIYSDGLMTNLGVLDGCESWAYGINDSGEVVGQVLTFQDNPNGEMRAFIHRDGVMTYLDNLVPPGSGWKLRNAFAINNNGWIVGTGHNPDGQGNAFLLVAEPVTTPPVADADGPYSIYVDDVLTLDASGSIDDDNDIVSYMWDLDDNNSFETDAGGQAVFDVNYAYLQSLGLLVNYTHTIHLKVTDSEGQSDVADSTLIIVPKPAIEVAVDIKPGSCPNPVNVKSSGVLPVAILGAEDVNVITIDPTSVRLSGVEPLRSSYEDVAGPVSDVNDCNCITNGPDGFLDLTLKFATQRIVEAVGDVNDGDELQLELIGVLFDETPIEGTDYILIRGRHKPINPADINKDGVVNAADFAIFAQNWLQSSIVDE